MIINNIRIYVYFVLQCLSDLPCSQIFFEKKLRNKCLKLNYFFKKYIKFANRLLILYSNMLKNEILRVTRIMRHLAAIFYSF